MRKHIYDYTGTRQIRMVDDTPECGEDFCDSCGDCLSCYGDDDCRDGGTHFWVEYGDKSDDL